MPKQKITNVVDNSNSNIIDSYLQGLEDMNNEEIAYIVSIMLDRLYDTNLSIVLDNADKTDLVRKLTDLLNWEFFTYNDYVSDSEMSYEFNYNFNKKHLNNLKNNIEIIEDDKYKSSFNQKLIYNDEWKRNNLISKNIKQLDYKVNIEYSSLATAKIYTLFKHFPNTEWGVYLKYKIPDNINLSDKYLINLGNNTLDIKVIDLLIAPLHQSVSNIDFLETIYPDLMVDVFKAKEKGFRVSGKLHSHHKLGAFHSFEDINEFKRIFDTNNMFISTVISGKLGFESDIRKQFDSLFNLDFESKIGLPPFMVDVKYEKIDFILNTKTILTHFNLDDIGKADKFLSDYINMLETVRKYDFYVKALDKLKVNRSLYDIINAGDSLILKLLEEKYNEITYIEKYLEIERIIKYH